jgi:hypothetical protein
LNRILCVWAIKGCDRVGFEVLIPDLLRYLQRHGVCFDFPARKELKILANRNLEKLMPGLMSLVPNTLVQSLEVFSGVLDFDLVKHHKTPES